MRASLLVVARVIRSETTNRRKLHSECLIFFKAIGHKLRQLYSGEQTCRYPPGKRLAPAGQYRQPRPQSVARRLKRFDDALASYNQAVALAPNHKFAH